MYNVQDMVIVRDWTDELTSLVIWMPLEFFYKNTNIYAKEPMLLTVACKSSLAATTLQRSMSSRYCTA